MGRRLHVFKNRPRLVLLFHDIRPLFQEACGLANAKKIGVSPGGFIMVHGQRNNLGWLSLITQRLNWTNGCIALTNSEMDEFMALVDVGSNIQISW
jgi:murein L,D-transpeptidase YafK